MALSQEIKEKLLTEAKLSATRSGGPGGQNVNKVNTKVELRFSINESNSLTDNEKHIILNKLNNRINSAGELIITSATERSQWKNRLNAEFKFLELIELALTKQKRRKKTNPTAVSKTRRLESKKKLSLKKTYRKPPEF